MLFLELIAQVWVDGSCTARKGSVMAAELSTGLEG